MLHMRQVGKRDSETDAGTLALLALGWIISDASRADRLLALTGLDADALREGVADSAIWRAVLGFLADHEPDLVACADAIATSPENLVAAQQILA